MARTTARGSPERPSLNNDVIRSRWGLLCEACSRKHHQRSPAMDKREDPVYPISAKLHAISQSPLMNACHSGDSSKPSNSFVNFLAVNSSRSGWRTPRMVSIRPRSSGANSVG